MEFITFIGISASALTAVSLIPQLVKIAREKKAEDISLLMLTVLLMGLCLWVFYGFLKNDVIIILANAFSVTINIATGLLTLYFKKQSPSTNFNERS